MEKVKVFGPKGNPNAPSGPTKYTLVPYEEVIRKEEEAKAEAPSTSASSTDLRIPASEWTFADQNMAIGACHCMHHKKRHSSLIWNITQSTPHRMSLARTTRCVPLRTSISSVADANC